jgi:presequence protease
MQCHADFDHLSSHAIPSLRINVEQYRHRATGALHIHLAAEDDQNAFLVALRTVPGDSTGVAHILEHTALCGSQRYPVRDPFFMMTRRSLSTFMNAFTSSDWTAYPFASCNRKDFDNLRRIYLDAVFFPNLNRLDFAQEGHRLEFSQSDDPTSALEFKGIVFNEMKGAMSSPTSVLYQQLTHHIFPTITYHHNSGGDPAAIPDLSYEELKAFHARHYHPSNALFMTYGDIPAAEQQAEMVALALNRFERLDHGIHVNDEVRYSAPKIVEDRYAIDASESSQHKTHIVIGWLLGHSIDMRQVLRAQLLAGVLLDNGASPLRHALESTDLAAAPSPLCGLQDSTREMIFAAGVEGSEPEHAAAVEALILGVLEKIAAEGVEKEQVEAVLHQLELSQREISGDGFPFGLQLLVHALGPALHGVDPVAALDIDPILAELRQQIEDADFIPSLVRELLTNPHRVRLTLRPDPNLAAEQQAAEAERLAALQQQLTPEAAAAIIADTHALKARQAEQDDPEILPRVGLADIPADMRIAEGLPTRIADHPLHWYGSATNGLVYQQIIIELETIPTHLRDWLPLYSDLLTELGCGGRDYLATQARQAAVTGGISAHLSIRGTFENLELQRGYLVISGKALRRNSQALGELMWQTFATTRFDELSRIREIISQDRMRREQSVTGRGHSLAMTAASQRISPVAALEQRWSGLASIQDLKQLDDRLGHDSDYLATLSNTLSQLHEQVIKAPRQLLMVGEERERDELLDELQPIWRQTRLHLPGNGLIHLNGTSGYTTEAWTTSTQVNFCSRAYRVPPANHTDAPALQILGGFLRNNFLHRAIREEGGAYGGGASYDADSGSFRFYSYRDPRLHETLADFDRALDWLQSDRHPQRLVEEAILGVISAIDKPGSPAGEAKKAFHANLHGRTPEIRRAFRQRLLNVTLADLQHAASTWLQPGERHTAVITSPAMLSRFGEMGLEVKQL